jgi:glycosyltransferase involved in cell wall biosynthesis
MQVVLSLTPGGTERLVVEMCKRLQPEFRVSVCCLDDEGDWATDVRREGVDVTPLRRRAGFKPAIGRRIASLAADRRVQLLHCHQYSPFVYGRIATSWNRGLKLMYTEHGRLSDAPPTWKRRLVNPVLSRFDGAIVGVSHELRRYMIEAGFPESRVGVIHNGISPNSLPSAMARARARRALGLEEDVFVAMTVARLDPVKDLPTLIAAFATVRRSVPRSRLVIVGDGPERAHLTDLVRRFQLTAAVDITGFRSDVRDLLPAADLYASSSISEGVSITILEAMAAGVPVVATAVGGTPEILTDGTGRLVPKGDPERLASVMISLAMDRRQRDTLAAAARRRLETAFTIDRMVEDYARTYRRLLD